MSPWTADDGTYPELTPLAMSKEELVEVCYRLRATIELRDAQLEASQARVARLVAVASWYEAHIKGPVQPWVLLNALLPGDLDLPALSSGEEK